MSLVDKLTTDTETQLAQLVEELAGRIERGDPIDLDDCCTKHPLWAEQIRSLVPVLKRLSLLHRRATG